MRLEMEMESGQVSVGESCRRRDSGGDGEEKEMERVVEMKAIYLFTIYVLMQRRQRKAWTSVTFSAKTEKTHDVDLLELSVLEC
jgi:hypothetical protein